MIALYIYIYVTSSGKDEGANIVYLVLLIPSKAGLSWWRQILGLEHSKAKTELYAIYQQLEVWQGTALFTLTTACFADARYFVYFRFRLRIKRILAVWQTVNISSK